jgi:SET domain-containing protein
MFLFKTEVKVATDPRMGLGLFATEFIPKDSTVWEYVEGVDIEITIEEVEQMSEAQQEYFDKYGWVEGDYYYASGDLSNFINHSYKPNIKNVDEIVIAYKDIKAGEEIFINYAEFDDCFDEYKDEYI